MGEAGRPLGSGTSAGAGGLLVSCRETTIPTVGLLSAWGQSLFYDTLHLDIDVGCVCRQHGQGSPSRGSPHSVFDKEEGFIRRAVRKASGTPYKVSSVFA